MTNTAAEDCLNAYILTFNCARNLIPTDRFAAHLFDVLPPSYGDTAPEILVLSLQEVAPIHYAFLGGSFLVPYLNAFQKAVEIATRNRWPNTTTTTSGEGGYVNVVTHHCGLTALMVFVRADVADNISWKDTAEVGVGLQEMGNKGAVGARLGYAYDNNETMGLTFVAAHIAPMEHAYERRNRDWRRIVERLVFTKSGDNGDEEGGDQEEDTAHLLQRNRRNVESGMFSPRSHLFFAGDLNYRTSDVPPIPEDHGRYPQPHDTPSDASHHSKLFQNDQLTRELRAKRTLHGLTEAPVTFPPTYKYSVEAQKAALLGNQSQDGPGDTWKWATRRWPSWCDRILYLEYPPWMSATNKKGDNSSIQVQGYNALPLFPTSDHRAVALAVSVPLRPITSPPSQMEGVDDARLHPPFSIDPSWKARRENARVKEVVVGGLAYLALTWEGNGILLATVAGVLGGWVVLRSLLQGEVSGGLLL